MIVYSQLNQIASERGAKAKEQEKWMVARQADAKAGKIFFNQIKRNEVKCAQTKKEIWKVQSQVRTKQRDCVKGRIWKTRACGRDRLKREKWRRGRIKMDKEREIMSDERRQPEVPTWMSDLIAEFQHLCQLWNVKRQLIHLGAAVGTNKPLTCDMLSNGCHLIIHFDRVPQKVIVLKRMSQKKGTRTTIGKVYSGITLKYALSKWNETNSSIPVV